MLVAEKKLKLILDTDPGVDDTVCLIYALFDKKAKVELITTVSGNVNIDKATRNILHLIDLLGVDVPVAKGAKKPL
ncbi:MAG: nucleoside hydrolase, partial [Clostridia bacterium]|nr:nucleoside hydrolase [Clostridia bacterium]